MYVLRIAVGTNLSEPDGPNSSNDQMDKVFPLCLETARLICNHTIALAGQGVVKAPLEMRARGPAIYSRACIS